MTQLSKVKAWSVAWGRVAGSAVERLLQPSRRSRAVAIGLACSLLFCFATGLYLIAPAFRDPWIVQDDARQHVFWMLRFSELGAFPNNLIADYFEAVAPLGYTALYRLGSWLGVEPLTLNHVLPLPIALVTTAIVYGLTLALLPLPLTGFLATVILNLSLWMKDDVVSGTPRAFVYLVLSLFLLGAVKRRWWWMLGAIILTASFYPQYVIVEGTIAFIGAWVVAIPALRRWDLVERVDGTDRRTNSAKAIVPAVMFWLSLWGMAIVVLSIYALNSGDYGPTISAEEARQSAEFWPRGRSMFFRNDPIRFWLTGRRSGFIPQKMPLFPWLGVLLPVTLRWQHDSPLAQAITPRLSLLLWWLISAVGLFGLAHVLLFRLHLPSRYAHHNLKLLLAIAAAITITLWVEGVWRWARSRSQHLSNLGVARSIKFLVGGFAVAIILTVVVSPLWLASQFNSAYKTGHQPQLYSYLRATSLDTVVAGVDGELDNLPTFGQRSIVFGFEYAIPCHVGYYQPLKRQAIDNITSFFSTDRAIVADFVRRYDLAFWLVRLSNFDPEILRNESHLGKLAQSEFQDDPLVRSATTAIKSLEAGQVPILAADINRCAVVQEADVVLLDAPCTAQASPSSP